MDLIHIHGYKCAGTTIEKVLLREYPDLLRIESENSGQRLFFDDIPSKFLKVKAISSHLLSPQKNNSALQISLIRDPYERLISAWKFQNEVVAKDKSSFREFVLKYKSSILSNYQCKLLSTQEKSKNFSSGWEINIDLEFLFGPNFFLGCVERFDESMTLIEIMLKERGVVIDLSYPNIANSTKHIYGKRKIPDLKRFAYSSIDADNWLWKYTNKKMDSKIESITNFKKYLENFKERCNKSVYANANIKILEI